MALSCTIAIEALGKPVLASACRTTPTTFVFSAGDSAGETGAPVCACDTEATINTNSARKLCARSSRFMCDSQKPQQYKALRLVWWRALPRRHANAQENYNSPHVAR